MVHVIIAHTYEEKENKTKRRHREEIFEIRNCSEYVNYIYCPLLFPLDFRAVLYVHMRRRYYDFSFQLKFCYYLKK